MFAWLGGRLESRFAMMVRLLREPCFGYVTGTFIVVE